LYNQLSRSLSEVQMTCQPELVFEPFPNIIQSEAWNPTFNKIECHSET